MHDFVIGLSSIDTNSDDPFDLEGVTGIPRSSDG